MRTYHRRALGAAAALAGAALLAACGSSGAPGAGPSTSRASTAAASAAATPTFSRADIAFTTGMLRLENQAAALAAMAPGRTSHAQVRQYADRVRGDSIHDEQMRHLMGQWGRNAPAPYTPGATPPTGSGPGMMSAQDWRQIAHASGNEFNDRFTDAMIANRQAEIGLCRAEAGAGASARARALARDMLAERQSERARLQGWEHQWPHDHDHGHGGRMGD